MQERKMIRDYHIHAQVLTKPEGVEAFLHTAAERGIGEICITDHMPLRGNSASDRIPAGQIARYCDTVRNLAESRASQLSVRLGIEIDYHPSHEEQIARVLSEGTFDYVLGSSHLHVLPAVFTRYRTHRQYAAAMFENSLRAVQSGLFDGIAHLDMYRWIFSDPDRFPLADDGLREEEIAEMASPVLDAMRANGVRLEINPHFAQSRGDDPACVYPHTSIVGMALEKGVPFVFGSDAHRAKAVGGMLPLLREHPVYGKALRLWESEDGDIRKPHKTQ